MGNLQRKINKSKKAKLFYLIQGKDIEETIDIATGNVEKLFAERKKLNRAARFWDTFGRFPNIPPTAEQYRQLYNQEPLPMDHPYKEQPDEDV